MRDILSKLIKNNLSLALVAALILLLPVYAAHGGTIIANVDGRSGPWDVALNPSYPYETFSSGEAEILQLFNMYNPIKLPKTGQTKCYDANGDIISCTNTGQDGEIQAGVAWPEPRFQDNGDQTVTDKLTGLTWTKDGNTPGVSTCEPGLVKTWQEALDYVKCLNTSSYLGHDDWRLPNINELESLVNIGEENFADWLDFQGFANVQDANYWTSTTLAYNTRYAWVVRGTGHTI